MKKSTREERQRRSDIEQARAAGIGPKYVCSDASAAAGAQIPQFITKTPWYLTHQIDPRRLDYTAQPASSLGAAARQPAPAQIATRFRDGACTNCGSLTHSDRDCIERPRKLTAFIAGESLCQDEAQGEAAGRSFAEKRDRWNGFDVDDGYAQILGSWRDRSPEDAQSPHAAQPAGSLRIREDTAKYLQPSAASYDPKTRSMRGQQQPLGHEFVAPSGEQSADARELHALAWEQRGAAPDSGPTEAGLQPRRERAAGHPSQNALPAKLLDRYGGAQYLRANPLSET